MNRIILLFFFLTSVYTQLIGQGKDKSSILDVNFQNLVSRADLIYDKPAAKSEEGMPIGNGVMGSLVWTTPSALHFQLNRTDVFANNSASDNFYQRNTDYCNGLAFVDVDMATADVFAGQEFKQHLSCYNGLMTVAGKDVTSKILAWNEQDVMAIEIESKRANSLPILTNLRTLRLPITKRGDHEAISEVKVEGNKIILTQRFREKSFYCGSAVVIEITGYESKPEILNASHVRLTALAGTSKMTVLMASAASFNPEEDLISSATKKLEAAKAKGFDGLLKSNQEWWKNFWSKAFIHLHSSDSEADFIEKHYTYYLYVMASSSRGTYPTKFNGMLWTTNGDERKWGALYWGANQSCLYTALPSTNHLELMDPMFNMYTSAYKSFESAAQQQWGSQGIYIPETVSFDGTVPLPEDIAAEMRDLYLIRKPWSERSENFVNFAYTKLPFMSRWNWKKDEGWKDGRWHTGDKGGGVYGHVTHIFSRGAKIAYQYWLKYEYTQDVDWLRDKAYPMLKGVAEFYCNFPNVKKEADGKYHIYNVNDNESIWGGHNTVEEISSMMGIFPAVIKASSILNVDADMRPKWKEFIDNLSPLPLTTDYKKTESTEKVKWVRSLPPMVQGNGERNPDGNTMPVWFFDLCNLESDKKTLEIANATYDAYFPNGITEKTRVNVLSKLPVSGAVLGRKESTRYLLPNQIRTAEVEVMANRMDLREGFQTTSVQRLGRAADALQSALCQSIPAGPAQENVIRVFPAWPTEWDAQFTLLCRGAFLVTSSMKNGTIEFVEIASQAGKECRIRNPWAGEEVTIYKNGKSWKKTSTDLIIFPTSVSDRFVVVKKGDTASKFARTLLSD